MKLSEIKCEIGQDGCLLIPAQEIAEMGLKPGDEVYVSFLSSDGWKNDFAELMLSDTALHSLGEEVEQRIRVPAELLDQAGIPRDADLQIICVKGCLLITRDDAMDTDELEAIVRNLTIADEVVSQLPAGADLRQIGEQLKSICEDIEGRSLSHGYNHD